MVKNPPADAEDTIDARLIPGSERYPWRRKWQPTPVFLPERSYGQRNLVAYSPWGHKESDMTECTHIVSLIIPSTIICYMHSTVIGFRGYTQKHERVPGGK